MSNITVSNKQTSTDTTIGAIICRTPKTLNDTIENHITYDNRCVLINSTDQLIEYFGDPFIDPSTYTDLIVAYKLVAAGYPMYISSIYEMSDNDGFKCKYNGYTEFYFKDKSGKDGHKTVGYKLKSNIKFCQPIIQSDYNSNTGQLDLYVSLYLMRRDILKSETDLNKLENNRLYNTYHLSLLTKNLTDSVIIDTLDNLGLELQIINGSSSTALIDEFKRFKSFRIVLNYNKDYIYEFDLHNNLYRYNFTDNDIIFNAYNDAIDRFRNKVVQPDYVCISKLYHAVETWVNNNLVRSYMIDLDTYSYPIIYNYLLLSFDEDSNTYLFINAPDVSISTAINLFSQQNEYADTITILPHYNCDLFYGYAGDYINNSLYYTQTNRVYYSAAILTLYNIIYNQSAYLTNSIGNFNISCDCIKSIISEQSADLLLNAGCNPIVTFDKGYPSIYGDRSLSTSPNLRFSHISRNVVYIRKLIRDYIETIKFTILNMFNIQLSISYIQHNILDNFKESGILSRYTVDYNINNKVTEININLWFNGIIESINLNFTI